MNYYHYISNDYCPYYNLATEHNLMKYVPEDGILLFLWQNQNTIVIGRNQNVYSECKVNEFINDGGRIARRMSGGGAVYHDIGNLNYSIICGIELYQSCKYYKLIKETLLYLKIDAVYNDRNDLIVLGKKVSGNAEYRLGNIICQHGTILVNSDIQKMTYYLTPDISKLNRNGVQSVKSRVGNISAINSGITVNDVKDAIVKITDSTPFLYQPDIKDIEELTGFYKSDTWIFGGKR